MFIKTILKYIPNIQTFFVFKSKRNIYFPYFLNFFDILLSKNLNISRNLKIKELKNIFYLKIK